MVCALFGHGNTPDAIYPQLKNEMVKLIRDQNITEFLVGTHGAFDRMALKILRELSREHPQISYNVVLAYIPGGGAVSSVYEPAETLFPMGIEKVPKRFAITWRNKWMVRESETILCYINHPWGGAAQAVEYGRRQGKTVVNLGSVRFL